MDSKRDVAKAEPELGVDDIRPKTNDSNLEPKKDVQYLGAKTETSSEEPLPGVFYVEDVDQSPRKLGFRPYLAATGLLLSWMCQLQFFSMALWMLLVVDLELGPDRLFSYLFVAWLITTIIPCVSLGSFSDYFGRKWFIVGGNLFVIIGAAVACSAQSVPVVIIGTSFMGFGSCGQQVSQAAIAEIFPRKWRGYTIGALEVSAFPFRACGITIAGAMIKYATWRWIFYLQILVAGLAFLFTLFFYNVRLPPKTISTADYLKSCDWIGHVSLLLGLCSLGLAVGWISFVAYRWDSAANLTCLIIGVVIVLGHIAWEVFFAGSNALFPYSLRTFGYIVLQGIVVLATFPSYAVLFVWPLEAMLLYELDFVKSGIYSFPVGFGMQVGAVASAWSMYYGHHRLQICATVFFLSLCIGLMATVTPGSVRPAMGYLTILGLANGYAQVLLPTTILLAGPDSVIGHSSGLLLLARYVGGAISLVICLAILQSKMGYGLIPGIINAVVPDASPPLRHFIDSTVRSLIDPASITSITMLIPKHVGSLAVTLINTSFPSELTDLIKPIAHPVITNLRILVASYIRTSYYPLLAAGCLALIAAFLFAPDVKREMDNTVSREVEPPFSCAKLHKEDSEEVPTTWDQPVEGKEEYAKDLK